MRPPDSSPSGSPEQGAARLPSRCPDPAGGPEPPPSPRERILAATAEVVAERGYEEASVADIARRAGVDEAELHSHFADKDDCCIQAFNAIADGFDAHVLAAIERLDDAPWRDRLRTAAYTSARWFRANEDKTRFGMVEIFRAGEMARTHLDRVLQRQVWLIDAGRQELDDPESVSRATAEAVVGSIVELVVKRLSQGGMESLEDLVPELMFVAVRPYLGLEAAREELTIPPPP